MSLNLSPEMAQTIEDEAEKYGLSNAKYLRALIREAQSSPFDPTDSDVDLVVDDSDVEDAQKGAA
ncbi:hypothetical protein LPA44_04060 [Halobacterium sp. KA-4]|uniref:hypothetical protein n=1 Tax=Halobacterium sp. KA-4 TaxID=2896367 RepID=UPI001E44418C|nr:hypothetical protein [Halobacterium sp. KA-4]MCD2199073.1 hypothetical protein [Halobacterium sp. KA-4]